MIPHDRTFAFLDEVLHYANTCIMSRNCIFLNDLAKVYDTSSFERKKNVSGDVISFKCGDSGCSSL